MSVRRFFSVVAACGAILAGAGCGERDRTVLPAETDEPYYVQGKQLIKQGRNPEALSYFLKVIDRRGERGAAESHLEAGFIYLHHTKDPVEAYHHFRKYLDLQPNSKEAAGVRGKVQDALREFARTLPGRPMDDQSVKLEAREALERQQREIEELRAQVATLRGGGGTTTRPAPVITLPADTPSRPPGAPLTAAQTPATGGAGGAAGSTGLTSRTTSAPSLLTPIGSAGPATTPRASSPPPSGRTHTVARKDTLYGISMKLYGHGRQVEAIYQANRDVMKDRTDLRPGMILKIPADAAPAARR